MSLIFNTVRIYRSVEWREKMIDYGPQDFWGKGTVKHERIFGLDFAQGVPGDENYFYDSYYIAENYWRFWQEYYEECSEEPFYWGC